MTPSELAAACQKAIDGDRDWINLVVDRPGPIGMKIRLVAQGGRVPRGVVLNWQNGETLAQFKVMEVLAWLVANGAVEVRGEDERPG